ncbi:MAG: TetR/AcrR family transcriptional regulator [Clostridia bacterium]|nr:TetR/AcrR family transcriptional regulator [Clostridia bacterium]
MSFEESRTTAFQKSLTAMLSLLKGRDFDSITVKDLSSACGFSRQYFYRFFSDKYALVECVFLGDVTSFREETFFRGEQGTIAVLTALLKHAPLYKAILVSRDYAWLYRLFFEYGAAFARAHAEYSLYGSFSEEQEGALRFYLSGVVTTLFSCFSEERKRSAGALAKLFLENAPPSLRKLVSEETTSDYILYKLKKFRQDNRF